MKTLLKRHEELVFTFVAYGLLMVVLLSFVTVRWTKATYAMLEAGPKVLSLYPSSVVPGASQRVNVISERTHFGPETTVHSSVAGVILSDVRFVSERELSFRIYIHERPDWKEGDVLPVEIWSPKERGLIEDVLLPLTLSAVAEPIELDLFNFEGQDRVTVKHDYVMFGYRPRGYAPFHLQVKDLDQRRVLDQRTSNEIEHFGVPLTKRETAFELSLRDSLGREV